MKAANLDGLIGQPVTYCGDLGVIVGWYERNDSYFAVCRVGVRVFIMLIEDITFAPSRS